MCSNDVCNVLFRFSLNSFLHIHSLSVSSLCFFYSPFTFDFYENLVPFMRTLSVCIGGKMICFNVCVYFLMYFVLFTFNTEIFLVAESMCYVFMHAFIAFTKQSVCVCLRVKYEFRSGECLRGCMCSFKSIAFLISEWKSIFFF